MKIQSNNQFPLKCNATQFIHSVLSFDWCKQNTNTNTTITINNPSICALCRTSYSSSTQFLYTIEIFIIRTISIARWRTPRQRRRRRRFCVYKVFGVRECASARAVWPFDSLIYLFIFAHTHTLTLLCGATYTRRRRQRRRSCCRRKSALQMTVNCTR